MFASIVISHICPIFVMSAFFDYTHALTRLPSAAMAHAALSQAGSVVIDLAQAELEHDGYNSCLGQLVSVVEEIPAGKGAILVMI